jgi:methionyl-tRNA formyltransferase
VRVSKREVHVGTGTHPVALGEVQPQGRKHMTAVDWARGIRLGDEDRLGR